MAIPENFLHYEGIAYENGALVVAGVDEAGRGPLAGPVVAAAVVLPPSLLSIAGVNDSKKVSEKKREKLIDVIKEQALCWGVGVIDEKIIDEINVLRANFEAMKRAVRQLSPQPDFLLIDGDWKIPGMHIRQMPIVDGDALSLSIACASIIAKVTRDRMMIEYDAVYPQYGFAKHKGYGTKDHIAAIIEHGPCEIHRKTFGKVKEYC